ncbi:hypothetical protein QBC39DRAFT_341237 [Podospora conica]|nr:hypothetical protein QBC39DRAFT_341237 [Schizothecium conicum]
MEGLLTVPPERGTIIGRAIWKPRYVVVGSAHREPQTTVAAPNSRLQTSRGSTPRGVVKMPEGVFLAIYKSKDDVEPIQQHAIATITECQIQMLAHRKQGPVLATLVIGIVPDPVTDKLRKRRSSRTAGLTATKETAPTTLYFRPGQEGQTLQEWVHVIHELIQAHVPDRSPFGAITPTSPTFTNPFAPRPRDASEVSKRPNSGNASASTGARPPFFSSKSSGNTTCSRERPVTYSETHSLRSRPSDLSSHASSMNPLHMGFHNNYTTRHPGDLPSPATTLGDYGGEFIEGWTSAQGRSSTLSSPIQTRDSIGSQIPPLAPQPGASSSPPIRETILDRAFQLRYIPGSDRELPDGDKLSSLARFDALMREEDEKRKTREASEAALMGIAPETTPSTAENPGLKSAWDVDDDSDSDDSNSDDGDDRSEGPVGEMDPDLEDGFPVPPTAHRALQYIAGGRQPPRTQPKSPLSFNQDALMALSSGSSTRPLTGYSKRTRPTIAQRTHSQPQLAGMMMAPHLRTPPAPAPAAAPVKQPEDLAPAAAVTAAAAAPVRPPIEKRLSTSSIKRQSFTDFTKRLSSTSSLLLFQSGASSRGSNSDADPQQPQQQQPLSHHLHPRATSAQHPSASSPVNPAVANDRCGWRGSVGVFGAEGGFL